ncbi:MAG: flavin reductase family protein [Gemmatimonadetes bacterium]|nr:flavin reductase family protein [Gemmatimonadota bacterium]MYI98569.1 flavin reductase family protein [Gemmatimonadota bacterium]
MKRGTIFKYIDFDGTMHHSGRQLPDRGKLPDKRGKMAFDQMEQRRIMGHFATGVTVVTTCYEDRPQGMTANAVASLSLDPPLILVSVDVKAQMNTYLRASDCFAVNILTEEQEEISVRFAKHGPKDFSGIAYRTEATGSPVFEQALAYVDCRVTEILQGGDHDIFIGEIVAGGAGQGRPLVFYGGQYGTLSG